MNHHDHQSTAQNSIIVVDQVVLQPKSHCRVGSAGTALRRFVSSMLLSYWRISQVLDSQTPYSIPEEYSTIDNSIVLSSCRRSKYFLNESLRTYHDNINNQVLITAALPRWDYPKRPPYSHLLPSAFFSLPHPSSSTNQKRHQHSS